MFGEQHYLTQDFPNYAAGTWGPSQADRLIQQAGRQWLVDGPEIKTC